MKLESLYKVGTKLRIHADERLFNEILGPRPNTEGNSRDQS